MTNLLSLINPSLEHVFVGEATFARRQRATDRKAKGSGLAKSALKSKGNSSEDPGAKTAEDRQRDGVLDEDGG